MKIFIQSILLLFVANLAFSQYRIKDPKAIPLHGEWQFAMDPAEKGILGKWYTQSGASGARYDKVTIPHCFTTDPRFGFYTGTVWYRKAFPWKPELGKRIILHFDAAYYKTQIWLNDQKVGEHEGGYTPFHFDVTDFLKDGENLLAVSVNNDTWQTGSIPGAKDHNQVNDSFMGWVNYGGLIRPVYFTIEPEVYAENIKIEAIPDLAKGTAILKTKIRIRNASRQPANPKANFLVNFQDKPVNGTWKSKNLQIAAGQTGILESETTLTAAQTKLWNLDEPNLYSVKAMVGSDTISANFGIRQVEIKNVQLLLNGKSLKLAGGNRVVDYPALGSLEPDWLIEKDFKLMKEAGMEFQRLTHYTPSEYFYDLADKYGMLIITEAGNWQLTPRQMDNDTIRKNFRNQFTEMAERDWNHPSVIAYSVGNEYESKHESGKRWTKDMIQFARQLDPTRLYTFATMFLNSLPEKPEDEASQYVDFISTNTYGGHARSLDHIHKLYPDKPILISEWGVRADAKMENETGLRTFSKHDYGTSEVNQAKHVSEVVAEIRKRPYVIGASWWTFNDYESRYHGTNVNGYRPWGIVRPDRSLRPAYFRYQKEMSPIVVEKVGYQSGGQGTHELTLKITARNTFPAYDIQGYYIDLDGKKMSIPHLKPGESKEVIVPIKGFDSSISIAIYKPTGFQTTQATFELK